MDTTADPALLAQLAARAGVITVYHDVSGTRHEASPGALAAVLAALDLDASSDDAVRASLRTLDDDNWEVPLPPASVLWQGGASTLGVVRAAALGGAALAWQIELEDGSHRRGAIDAAAVIDARAGQVRVALPLPGDLPAGYHRLHIDGASVTLIVAPTRCWLPAATPQDGRCWGVACQLYALRAADDWGIGDFAALAALCEHAAGHGAALVGINPLHALFAARAEAASPYSPSSRHFLNPLYIAIPAVPEFATCTALQEHLRDPAWQAELARLRALPAVDYSAVGALKESALALLFATFEALPATHPRRRAYDTFCAAGGSALASFAAFEAWQLHHPDTQPPPAHALQDFASSAAALCRQRAWLQFEADRQLEAAAGAMRAQGHPGLYRDLAVGAAADGADLWMHPELFCRGTRIGAPPDPLGPRGQDWGLPPLNPRRLRALAFRPWIELLRANMRHAGALRIDHVMALQQLFWIPPAHEAADGLYVRYPCDELLAILCLESQRQRCMVIGEDLGTVPAGFRERMAAAGVLSYRLLYFERWESGLFKRPETYPELAVATPTSHDAAPLAGFLHGTDIALRHGAGAHTPGSSAEGDREARSRDLHMLADALRDQGLPTPDGDSTAFIAACHAYLARSPAMVLMLNADDLAAETLPVNLPGTVDEYPNWRRRLHIDVAALFASPAFLASLDALRSSARAAR